MQENYVPLYAQTQYMSSPRVAFHEETRYTECNRRGASALLIKTTNFARYKF